MLCPIYDTYHIFYWEVRSARTSFALSLNLYVIKIRDYVEIPR
jgi:hypothetical protein